MADYPGGKQHIGHRDLLNVATSICLTYTLLIIALRGYIRTHNYGIDDVVVIVATILAVVFFAISYIGLSRGMGNTIVDLVQSGDLGLVEQTSIPSIVIFLLALYAAKGATVVFLLRLTKTHLHIVIYYISMGILAVLGIVSISIVTIGCTRTTMPSGYYWDFSANAMQNPTQYTRWRIMTGIDVASEMFLLVLPMHLLSGLQMPMAKKLTIASAFLLRLPVIAFSVLRLLSISRLTLPDNDSGLTGTIVIIWESVELSYALACVTLSALRSFTDGFNTGFGVGNFRGAGETYDLSNLSARARHGSDSAGSAGLEKRAFARLAVSELGFKSQDRSREGVVGGKEKQRYSLKLRPDHLHTRTTTITSPARTLSAGGLSQWVKVSRSDSPNGEDDMVIQRTTVYEIKHEKDEKLVPW